MKSRISKQWFRSIVLIVVAILLVVLLLCTYLLNILQKNVLQISEHATQYMQQSVDSRLQEIHKNTVLFELHNTNKKIKKLTEAPASITQDIFQFCDQMQNFKISNSLVKSVFIYYPNIDCIAGNFGFYSSESYYFFLNKYPNNVFSAWNPSEEESTSRFISVQNGEEIHLLYVRTIRYNQQTVGIIVVEVDMQELLRSAQDYGENRNEMSTFGILVDGKAAVFSGALTMQRVQGYAQGEVHEQGNTIQTGDLTAHYVRSDYFPELQYVAGFNQRKLFAPLYTATLICMVGILVCVVIGIYFSIRVSRKNAQPLVNIMGKFEDKALNVNDEYQYISGKIDQLIGVKYSNEEKLYEQQKLIDNLFLSAVLQSELQDEYVLFSLANKCDILFENPYYQIVFIQADTPFTDEMECIVMRALREQELEFLVSYTQENMAVLLNMESAINEIRANKIAKYVASKFKELVKMGFGQAYDTMQGIYKSYTEALFALPQEQQSTSYTLGYYNGKKNKNIQAQQGLMAMEEFTRQLIAGRYKEAGVALNLVFSGYLISTEKSKQTKRRFKYLQNILLDEIEKKRVLGITVSTAMVQEIEECTQLGTLKGCAEKLLTWLEKSKETETKNKGSVPERAQELVKQNIDDPMLGLYMISNLLEVSNTYLSTSFKNTFGIGIVQYINQLRIDEAKKLILTTNLSIKEIALQVGFTSDISFIRVFKKYEEKTPASLRKKEAEE